MAWYDCSPSNSTVVRPVASNNDQLPTMPTTLKEFEAVFPTLVKDMKEHCQKYKLPDQALNWFEQVRHCIAYQHIQAID
jgi:farnesyl diphosphate synthase